ncbi:MULTISPECIES: Mrp/NBP35 family ATP-binding protein [unclassified Candidatus Tisiphia]|uniref:Mrp/NBP35 family ATP-binding protein n=1 Tax=unclassified Candidatus Tisiphia TaxID=2996318 RepID=UPI00312CC25C
MIDINQQQILNKISDITFSDNTKLVSIISNIIIKDKNIGFAIDILGKDSKEIDEIKIKAINKLNEIPNIGKITIVLTSSKGVAKKSTNPKVKHFIDGVKKIILVASGKGGVGKSTITALIAEQLNLEGYKVGIVDADIYGPSIPQIFGISGVPEIVYNKMTPLKSRGIEIISIGFLIKDHSAIVWRGPMASKTIYQLLSLTHWQELDYLIIDMPPGTGDIHLSILENYQLDGVIIVTTPQKMAAIDVVRSIDLYRKFNLPILGIIENMSYLVEPSSGKKIQIFNGNSGENFAKEYNIPLICKIPIEPKLSYNCDNSTSLTDIVKLPIKQFV